MTEKSPALFVQPPRMCPYQYVGRQHGIKADSEINKLDSDGVQSNHVRRYIVLDQWSEL